MGEDDLLIAALGTAECSMDPDTRRANQTEDYASAADGMGRDRHR